jgi:hypothetical protein
MNTDSSVNVVVFEVLMSRRVEQLLGEASTKVKDGIRRVWVQLAADFGVQPSAVRRVYSQWEATPQDRAFLAAEFPPTVKVSYSFPRPPARHDWGRATPEFACAVDAFDRRRFGRQLEKSGRGGGRSRRPWWQYWD